MAALASALPRTLPRPSAVDAVLALVLAAAANAELWLGGLPGPRGAAAVAAVATTLPLAWRTTAPVAVVGATTGGFAVAVLLGMPADEPVVSGLAPFVALYSLGAHGSPRAIGAGTALAIAGYSTASLSDHAAEVGLLLAGTVGAVAVGRAVREMGFERDELEARTERLERERDERARAAVAEERARIARELHDVIGHSISVMGVQAGAVRRLLDPEQSREREALQAVERIGRDAVEEMQRLLGFLRSDEEDTDVGAVPTLERVDALVAQMRRAGLDVELHVDGELDELSAGRALAAFRILQEALTNALRHAPGARVTANLRRTPAGLDITVVDDGGGTPPVAPTDGSGHGLVGMRERVALYGGTVEASPRDGGFAVIAHIPAPNV